MPIALTVTEGPHQRRGFTFRDHDIIPIGRSAQRPLVAGGARPVLRARPLAGRGQPAAVPAGGQAQRVTSADLCDGDLIQAGTPTLCVALVPEPKKAPLERPGRRRGAAP
jgi:hypothetical protein